VRKQNKDIEKELEALRASIDMLRPVVIQLQIDIHTLKSQQHLKDWSNNAK
jgi:prefoldin subunit 5